VGLARRYLGGITAFALPSRLGWIGSLDKRSVSLPAPLNPSRFVVRESARNLQESGFAAWITQAKSEMACAA